MEALEPPVLPQTGPAAGASAAAGARASAVPPPIAAAHGFGDAVRKFSFVSASPGAEERQPVSPGWRPNTLAAPKMSEEDKLNVLRRAKKKPWIIDPRNCWWMIWWDLGMLTALLFTATLTPYQIAFLKAPKVLHDGADFLYALNRIFDCFFIADVVIVCNTMYQEPLVDGGSWVSSRYLIVMRYFKSGWLSIDIVSCFPYFLIALILEASEDGGAQPTAEDGTTQNEVDYFSMRLVKLIRMLKLTRCMKAKDKVAPYLSEFFMGRLEITYAHLEVGKLFSLLLFYTHLQACLWALLSSLTDNDSDDVTWLRSFEDSFEASHGRRPSPWDAYVAALYWSAMTITSIGYGEMLPLNTGERLICSLMMLVSGMVWTFVLSTMAGVAATLNPNAVLFQTTMDALNMFMRERQLPRAMRRQLRSFFDQSRRVREVNDDTLLLTHMSPLLQGTVAFAANREWLHKIWWLRRMSDSGTRDSREFIANLAKSLVLSAYVASERPPLGPLRSRARCPDPRASRVLRAPLTLPLHRACVACVLQASCTCCARAWPSRTGICCAPATCGATTSSSSTAG